MVKLVTDKSAVPDLAAQDLLRLLGHSLATRSTAERRWGQLGLLIELVSSGTGEFITSTAYEEARLRRRREAASQDAADKKWPTASALSRAYGHWLKALRAACRFWFDGGRGRVPADYAHTKHIQSYHPQEIVSALLLAQQELGLASRPRPEGPGADARGPGGDDADDEADGPRGDQGAALPPGKELAATSPIQGGASSVATSQQDGAWPTQWEYGEWAKIKRQLARRAGIECRVPDPSVMRKAYGSYERAVTAAKRVVEHRDP